MERAAYTRLGQAECAGTAVCSYFQGLVGAGDLPVAASCGSSGDVKCAYTRRIMCNSSMPA